MVDLLIATAKIKVKIIKKRSINGFNIDKELEVISEQISKVPHSKEPIQFGKAINDMLDTLM